MSSENSLDYIKLSDLPHFSSPAVHSTQEIASSEAEQVARIEGVVAEWQEHTKHLPTNVRKLCMDRVREDADTLKQHLKGMISNGFSGPALKLIVDRALTDLNRSTTDFCRERGIALQQRAVTKQTLDGIDSSLDNVSLPARASVAQRSRQATTCVWQKVSEGYASQPATPVQEGADDRSPGYVQDLEVVPELGQAEEIKKEVMDSQFKKMGVKTPSIFGAIEAGAKAQVPEGEENVVRYKVLSGGAKYISKFIPGVGQAEFAGELAKEYEPGFRKLKEKYPLTGDYIEPPTGSIAQLCHFDTDPAVSIDMLHGMTELAQMAGRGVKNLRQQIVRGSAALCDTIGLTDQSVVEGIESYGYRTTAEFRQSLGEECGLAYASMQAHME